MYYLSTCTVVTVGLKLVFTLMSGRCKRCGCPLSNRMCVCLCRAEYLVCQTLCQQLINTGVRSVLGPIRVRTVCACTRTYIGGAIRTGARFAAKVSPRRQTCAVTWPATPGSQSSSVTCVGGSTATSATTSAI